jgi:hypothetical protein
LDQVLVQRQSEIAPELTETEYFELFTAEQILKDYELSYEEIASGVVGKASDGGIDSIYVFVNGELLQEDSELTSPKRDINIELIIIQAKVSKSFSETVATKFIDVTENLLNLSNSVGDYEGVYNQELREHIERFRNAYALMAAKFPKLQISYYYVTKGSTATINRSLHKKVDKLRAKIRELFSSAECSVEMLGASELLEMARRSPQIAYSLGLAENPVSSSDEGGFVCLVSLTEFSKFITDDEGNLTKNIFEANVRDYQGKTPVNEQIQRSLREPRNEDFWWLNNGVTILATRATLSGKTLSIESPEIVNGLQTSAEIHKYFKETNPTSEARNLLVRVVVPQEPESRDRIIKATNSQTTLPPASLRATEKIHRDIEEYLRPYGLYYDRRKNQYKNEGKPLARIVSIPYLAQAVMAIVLQRPDDARARPSSLLKRDDVYEMLFSVDHPISIYYFCVALMQRVEKFLRSGTWGNSLDRRTRGDIKFYVAMHTALIAAKEPQPSLAKLSQISVRDIGESDLVRSTDRVFSLYGTLLKSNPGESNKVAKSLDFKDRVKTDAVNLLNQMASESSVAPVQQ